MSTGSVAIKSFKLKLDKTIKGNPKPTEICCVFSNNAGTNMGIGYILGVGSEITELRCFNLGLKGVHSFMNTDKVKVGGLVSFRLGFSDKNGELSGFMMQGEEGDDIVATSNYDKEELDQVMASNGK